MNSSIILTGIKRGNTYVMYVSAVNILGESLSKDINGINNNVSLINVKILFSTAHIDETTVTTHTGLVYCLPYFIYYHTKSNRHVKCFITKCYHQYHEKWTILFIHTLF